MSSDGGDARGVVTSGVMEETRVKRRVWGSGGGMMEEWATGERGCVSARGLHKARCAYVP